MNRRSYISALAGGVVLTGCSAIRENEDKRRSATPETEPPFVITKPTVEQGETAVIEITAVNTEKIRFNLPWAVHSSGDENGLEIRLDNVEFSPSPPRIMDSDPPVWDWESPQDLEGKVHLPTSVDTSPGTYETSILFTSSDFEETQWKQTTINVKPGSED